MFGIGFSELLIIAVVAIVFVGPKRLPEVMKQLGRFFVHARRMSNEVRSTFDSVVQQAEQEIHLENLRKIKELTKGALTHPMIEAGNEARQGDDHHGHGHDHSEVIGHHSHGHDSHGVPGTEPTQVNGPGTGSQIKADFDQPIPQDTTKPV